MSFTCPRCGKTSHNPNDEKNGYCGSCHAFTGDSDLPYRIELCSAELEIINIALHSLITSTSGSDSKARIYSVVDHLNREKNMRHELMQASAGLVTCPHCGADVEPKFIFICPRCKREGCPECIPTGKHTICPECEEKED